MAIVTYRKFDKNITTAFIEKTLVIIAVTSRFRKRKSFYFFISITPQWFETSITLIFSVLNEMIEPYFSHEEYFIEHIFDIFYVIFVCNRKSYSHCICSDISIIVFKFYLVFFANTIQ